MVEPIDDNEEFPIAFQYSLCRVVLMVCGLCGGHGLLDAFQYSLCRVVLMVALADNPPADSYTLSVLALSSRFDGHAPPHRTNGILTTFSTRSVESF